MLQADFDVLISELYNVVPREQIESPAGRAVMKYFHARLVDDCSAAPVLAGKLAGRRLRIVRMVAAGLTNLEMAGRLNTSEGSVKVEVHHALRVVGCRNRVALAAWARAHDGWLERESWRDFMAHLGAAGGPVSPGESGGIG